MAKIKGIYSTKLAGKVGSVVYRNTVNGNIVSEKASNVSNPRTTLQQIQRAIFNSVVQSYSILKNIDDHAFASTYGSAKNMAKFLAINLPAVRNYVETNDGIHNDIDDIGDDPHGMVQKTGHFVPAIDNVITVTKGTLSSVNLYDSTSMVVGKESDTNYQATVMTAGVQTTATKETITYGEMLDAMGVDAGDQITLIAVCANEYDTWANGSVDIHAISGAKLHKGYVVMSPDLSRDTVLSEEVNVFSEISGVEVGTITENTGYVNLTLNTGTDIPYLLALIRSQKVDDVWQRSTEKLKLFTDYIDTSYYLRRTWYEILQTYDPSSPYYLNNAE